MKFTLPGQKPKPDDQGKSDTCTRHAVSKAVTGGLDDGRFGTKLDVAQNYVTNAMINKGKDVGGCWPTAFDQETILVMDTSSSEYYNIVINVAHCTYADLQQNWNTSKFVVVYKTKGGLHCIYVRDDKNGKLCCINSYGKKDQFPQLKPAECEIYKVDATVTKAPKSPMTKPKTRTTSLSTSQNNLTKQERLKLKREIATHNITNDAGIDHINVLLVGEIGAGKSSVFNSIDSVFDGHVTSRANAGSMERSLTTQYRQYFVGNGEAKDAMKNEINFQFCDSMGLEGGAAGLSAPDIGKIMDGHVENMAKLSGGTFMPGSPGYKTINYAILLQLFRAACRGSDPTTNNKKSAMTKLKEMNKFLGSDNGHQTKDIIQLSQNIEDLQKDALGGNIPMNLYNQENLIILNEIFYLACNNNYDPKITDKIEHLSSYWYKMVREKEKKERKAKARVSSQFGGIQNRGNIMFWDEFGEFYSPRFNVDNFSQAVNSGNTRNVLTMLAGGMKKMKEGIHFPNNPVHVDEHPLSAHLEGTGLTGFVVEDEETECASANEKKEYIPCDQETNMQKRKNNPCSDPERNVVVNEINSEQKAKKQKLSRAEDSTNWSQ